MKRLLVLALLLAGCSPVAAAPSTTDRWTQVFRDDFDQPVAANWRYELGEPKWTGEIATFTVPNVAVSQGKLTITPTSQGGKWTSGRIETLRSDFAYPAGGTLRVEASLKLPEVSTADGAGYWPAFWMLGAPIRDKGEGWPQWGELDIMEQVNGRPGIYAAMHATGVDAGSAELPCCVGGFHVFAMELSASEARFYVDGEMHHRVAASSMPSAAWQDATAHGFYLILNVAIGGQFPQALGGGPNAATVSGKPLTADYVAVYTRP
ncbi:family 16 glycosylhydrolase [Catelliglobosispora koreensis]|uniref:family 16 glycosylhydrolase n=1 Tax=Catelliglobosispora koreensis TaxID=129052 RepID=UPI00035D102B|nr:family 16 glycosylhydrolase [Catelliglobosispora koreensis]